MKLSSMKLHKGEKQVITKFAEVTRQREFEFGGVIDLNNGKSLLSTTTARFKIEAMQHFEQIAKRENGTLNIKTVRVIK